MAKIELDLGKGHHQYIAFEAGSKNVFGLIERGGRVVRRIPLNVSEQWANRQKRRCVTKTTKI